MLLTSACTRRGPALPPRAIPAGRRAGPLPRDPACAPSPLRPWPRWRERGRPAGGRARETRAARGFDRAPLEKFGVGGAGRAPLEPRGELRAAEAPRPLRAPLRHSHGTPPPTGFPGLSGAGIGWEGRRGGGSSPRREPASGWEGADLLQRIKMKVFPSRGREEKEAKGSVADKRGGRSGVVRPHRPDRRRLAPVGGWNRGPGLS